MKPNRPTPEPSPEEILAMCALIRSGWSEAETRKRAAWSVSEEWTAPVIEFDDDDGDREPYPGLF